MAIDVELKIEKSDVDRLSILVSLKQIKFSIGLFEKEHLTDKVIIHSLDESSPDYEYELPLSDILYFVEKGTINTRPLNLLEEIEEKMQKDLNFYLGKWIDVSLESKNPYESILAKVIAYKDYVNASLIPKVANDLLNNVNTINSVIKEEQDNVWFYDIKKLVRYITCRVEIQKI